MRLFICLILFVLFYGCASDEIEFEKENNLPYQIEWLDNQHVKVKFDSTAMLEAQYPNGMHGEVKRVVSKIKSLEILKDSAWYETSHYDSEKGKIVSNTFGFKTQILLNNISQDDSLILNTNNLDFYPLSTVERSPESQKKKINNVIPDRIILRGGQRFIEFSLTKDSISIIRKWNNIIADFPNQTGFTGRKIITLDTISISGKANTATLEEIRDAVNCLDLKDVSEYKMYGSLIGFYNGSNNYNLIIREQEKSYIQNSNDYTYGVKKLLHIVYGLKEEDLE
jgi:hypothetical protein